MYEDHVNSILNTSNSNTFWYLHSVTYIGSKIGIVHFVVSIGIIVCRTHSCWSFPHKCVVQISANHT